MEPDSTELARKASGGDRAALDDLWRRHRRWVAAVLLAHRPRGSDVDDVLQDVAMAVVRTIHTLREPERFRAWLRAVAVNTVRTVSRGAAAGPVTRNGLGSSAGDSLAARVAEGRPNGPSDGNDILAAVERLPIHYREPLLLRGVRGLSIRHIAETLDLPVKTVETRLLRARRMIWTTMTGQADASAKHAAATERSESPFELE